MIEAASAPSGRTLSEVLARFKLVPLVVPPSSSFDEDDSNRAAAALAASAEAFAVLAFVLSDDAVLAVAWRGQYDDDDRWCLR